MFDLSFFEIMVIAVVALIVIGPEKLPSVARNLGRFAGKAQRYISQVKEEVNREVRFDELKSLQGEIAAGVNKAKAGLEGEVGHLKSNFEELPEMLDHNGAAEPSISDEPVKQSQPSASTVKARHRKKGSRRNAVRK